MSTRRKNTPYLYAIVVYGYFFLVKTWEYIQYIFFFIPIKSQRIAFYTYRRKGYSCNVKYIAEELRKQYGSKIEIVWITNYPQSCIFLAKFGFIIVKSGSIRHWYYQFTAKIVIVNDMFSEWIRIRKHQITLNTWHAGMNYKKVGTNVLHYRSAASKKIFLLRNRQPDIYLSGSQFFTENMSTAFQFDKNIFIPTGCPRNDIFFADSAPVRKALEVRYGLSEEVRILCYAPTFRTDSNYNYFTLDFERLRRAISRKFGGIWTILYHRHNFVTSNTSVVPDYIRDVSDYEDINELLSVTDILISDYSSCLFDFSLTKRPAFVYAHDMSTYDRGLAYPLDKWPYPIALSYEELEKNISLFTYQDYLQRLERHHNDIGAFIYNDASARVVRLLSTYLATC